MPIDESLELIVSILETHFEDRHYKEWLLNSLIACIGGDKPQGYKQFINQGKPVQQANNQVNKTVEEIKKDNEDILNNFFK